MSQAMIKHYQKREEGGFTLIELLVVIIIIGILAAIAIPVFLNQRERAWRSAAESDLRNFALEVEAFFTDNLHYPEDQADLDELAEDFRFSTGVSLDYEFTASPADAFCMIGFHDRIDDGEEQVAAYDSTAGGLQARAAAADYTCGMTEGGSLSWEDDEEE